jgi:hypothetical protein
MSVKTIIQWRRDTAANWSSTNPVLHEGEAGYETDTKQFKIGDGTSSWNLLPYFSGGTSVSGNAFDAFLLSGM